MVAVVCVCFAIQSGLCVCVVIDCVVLCGQCVFCVCGCVCCCSYKRFVRAAVMSCVMMRVL